MPPKPPNGQPTGGTPKLDLKRTQTQRQCKGNGKWNKETHDGKPIDDNEFLVYLKDGSEASDVEITSIKKGKAQKKNNAKQAQKEKKNIQAMEQSSHIDSHDEEDKVEQIDTSKSRASAIIAKKLISKQMDVKDEVENVDVVRDQDYHLPNEEMKAEMNEEMKAENEKISKHRKVFEIRKDHEEIISIISKTYKLKYRELKLKDHDKFKELMPEELESIRNWYNNRQSRKVKTKPSTFKVPKVEYPNEVLMNLLGDAVLEEHKAYMAQILENNMPAPLQSHYTNLALQEILKDVESQSDDIEKLVTVVRHAPLHLRLKATARAIKLLEQKGGSTDDHKLSWFSHCIRPALEIQGRINYLEFDQQEIEAIKNICEFSNPTQLTDDEAYAYLKLLNHGDVLDLDQARKHFINHSDYLWKRVLEDICGINKEVAEIWAKYKSQMITHAMYKHYKLFRMNKAFANRLSQFQKLSAQDISDLYKMSHQKGFQMIADLLSKENPQDFQHFKNQADLYMKLENPSQIEACKHYLSRAPLDQWQKYKNQIMASSAIIGDDKALITVKDAITKMLNRQNLERMNETAYSKIERGWVKAFEDLNEKTVLQKFGWQKELVIQLVHLIITAGKMNVITTLCTGHGKSIIIQLLADILVEMDSDVIVVCMNDFLAHQSRTNYGSHNVQSDRITYMSIADFLKITPNSRTIVIYDEIDSMLGTNSFNLIQENETIKSVYNASLMKEWKAVIGFSGTISQSTKDQLIAELGDPICIDIPSLRVHGANNKIVGVVKTISQHNKFATIAETIMQRLAENENFIVIFEDAKDLYEYRQTSAFVDTAEKRNQIVFDDFDQEFGQIMDKLYEVAKDNFIVLTTKEGARGIDYKGVNPAHVIMAFSPKSYSECVQALGRGCRELSSFAEGTIICQTPKTSHASNYLDTLLADDGELAQAMKLNCKVARVFHSQTVQAKEEITEEDMQNILELKNITAPLSSFVHSHIVMLAFESLMKRGKNFKKVENSDRLWKALKDIDEHRKLPEHYYEIWKN